MHYTNAIAKRIVGPVEIAKEVETGTPSAEEHFIAGTAYEFDFTGPDGKEAIKLSPATALAIDASASGKVTGLVYGYTIGA